MTFIDALRLTGILLSVSVCINAIEYLSLSAELRGDTLIAWNICRMRRLGTISDRYQVWMDWAFGYAGSMIQMVIRLLLGLATLVFAPTGTIAGLIFAFIALTTSLWSFRSPMGTDGSDQMIVVLSGSLAILNFDDTGLVDAMSFTFIACQLAICYFTSGIFKFLSPEWRSGEAVMFVFRTDSYGSALLLRFLAKSHVFPFLLAWSVIVFEMGFPIIFFIRWPVSAFMLLIPVLFHVATAFFMGLNIFAFAYLASYPALLWVLNRGIFSVLDRS